MYQKVLHSKTKKRRVFTKSKTFRNDFLQDLKQIINLKFFFWQGLRGRSEEFKINNTKIIPTLLCSIPNNSFMPFRKI